MRGLSVGSVLVVVASGEPQRRTLIVPVEGESGISDEPARRQVRGVAPLEDRLCDIGSEESQFHEAGEVGTANADALRDAIQTIATLNNRLLELLRLDQEFDEARVGLALSGSFRIDEHLHFHARPPEVRRGAEDQRRCIARGRGCRGQDRSIVGQNWLEAFRKQLDLDLVQGQVDADDEGLESRLGILALPPMRRSTRFSDNIPCTHSQRSFVGNVPADVEKVR